MQAEQAIPTVVEQCFGFTAFEGCIKEDAAYAGRHSRVKARRMRSIGAVKKKPFQGTALEASNAAVFLMFSKDALAFLEPVLAFLFSFALRALEGVGVFSAFRDVEEHACGEHAHEQGGSAE